MIELRTRAWPLALVFALSALPALAQSTGRISGTLRDTSGAGIPGVTVTVTNQATGASQTASSGPDGGYTVSVPPGAYTVAVALKGFAKQTRRDLKLDANASLTADFTLEARLSEEITVTSMKREETIHDTPFSVAAPTEADLRSRGIDDIEGVARDVAGFSVQNLGPGQSVVAIRGASAGQIARDQPGVKESVGAYLDESVISMSLFTPDIDLFDVSRVEVLRGPQGTLFGSGSLSGTVRYISNQPELGVKKVFGEVGGNTIDGGNQGGNIKLGFNAPMGETAALRFAGYYTRYAGYMDTPGTVRTPEGGIRPDTANLQEDINTGDRIGFRAAAKFVPNSNWTITPRFVYQKVQMDGWNRIDDFNILANPYTTTRPAVTLGERELFIQIDEPFDDTFALGDLNISYDFGNVVLTSVTSYADRDIDVVRDAGALTSSITGGTIPFSEDIYSMDAPLDDLTAGKGWTQELRLTGGDDRLRWVGGAYYSDSERDYGQNLIVAGFEAATGIPTEGNFGATTDNLFHSNLQYDLSQFAVFGEGTYAFNDQFSATVGLRYYDFNEDKDQAFDGIFADAGGRNVGSTDANGVAPRFILSYKVSEDTNLNAQVSKGFRLGGINDPLNTPLCSDLDLLIFGGITTRPPPGSGLPPGSLWEDETAWNYEIGSKSRVMGGRGSFNASLFYMDISNMQAVVTAGTCSSRLVMNVPEASSVGGEVEFAAAPNENFDFAVSASYNDAQVDSSLPSEAATFATGIREGNRLPSVPEFQMSAAATYKWQMTSDVLSYLTGTYQHVGSRFTQLVDEEAGYGRVNLLTFPGTIGGPLTQGTFTFNPELPSYDLANLRFGVIKGEWDVSLYCNNLTDERAFLSLDRERGTRARVGYITNQPRTFGITARVTF